MYRKLDDEAAAAAPAAEEPAEECPCACSGEEDGEGEPGTQVDRMKNQMQVDFDLNG